MGLFANKQDRAIKPVRTYYFRVIDTHAYYVQQGLEDGLRRETLFMHHGRTVRLPLRQVMAEKGMAPTESAMAAVLWDETCRKYDLGEP